MLLKVCVLFFLEGEQEALETEPSFPRVQEENVASS